MKGAGPIPVLRVVGSHREAGEQVGLATAATIRRAVQAVRKTLPPGRTFADQLALAAEYRAVTAKVLPWLVDELDGAATAARVDPLLLFAASIEEIWAERPSQAAASPRSGASRDSGPAVARGARDPKSPAQGRCTDLLATPPATANGHALVAHTNDLPPRSEAEVVAIEWRVQGDPVVFSLGIGPWISVGWNDAGLSLTGDELRPNDERIGVPRLLMVREQLTKRTLADAVAAALRPDRASSYNTLLAHRDGGVVEIEGSATDAEILAPDPDGTLVHTNHYLDERMLRYEGDPAQARRSAIRYERARDLLTNAALEPGAVTPELLRTLLSDHANAPDSLCRHAAPGEASKTVFWCIAEVHAGRIVFGRGNPCTSIAQTYTFAGRARGPDRRGGRSR